jgi:hypothetical protein
MASRSRTATHGAAAAAAATATLAAVLLLTLRGPEAPAAVAAHPGADAVGCREQSGARFPGAYRDRHNLVVGPLAMIGGGVLTSAATVREFGGNKFPLLVRAGHRVTVSIPAPARATAALSYGAHADGDRDRQHTISFTACSRRRSGSRADGPVTFWSGFVLTSAPLCVPLDVYVDGATTPRRAHIALGRRCGQPPPLRGCADRAEGGKPQADAPLPGQVVVGPFRFGGLARHASRRQLEFDRAGRVYAIKAGVLLPAGVRATLSIGRRARGWASLDYAPRRPGEPRRLHDVIRFQACPADQPAFSYDGPLGPVTGFPGGFVLTRPGCLALEARVPGRPVVRATVRFGVRRCR